MVKNPSANVGDMSSIPGSGSSPGGANSNPLQYSCLGNSMDSGPWWATVTKSQTKSHKESDKTAYTCCT